MRHDTARIAARALLALAVGILVFLVGYLTGFNARGPLATGWIYAAIAVASLAAGGSIAIAPKPGDETETGRGEP